MRTKKKKLVININHCSSKSITKAIRAINQSAYPPTIYDIVYNTAERIRQEAEKSYNQAQYSGSKRGGYSSVLPITRETRVGSEREQVIGGMSKQTGNINGKDVYWYDASVAKEFTHKSGANYYHAYKVSFHGMIYPILEFGSGDRYIPTGYYNRMTTGKGTFSFKSHFISKTTGMETWVYRGEQGSNPYLDGQPLNKKGEPRVGYYYSSGNAPCRALYNAVQIAIKDFKNIVSGSSWSHWY